MTTGPAALDAAGLVKRYGSRVAVDDVGMHVAPGQIHGLLGPNGAGKTTLLRLLSGLVQPDHGYVQLLGGPVAAGDPAPDGVATVLATPSFYPAMSGRLTLRLLAGLDGVASLDRIPYALAATGLTGRADDRVGHYSLGMRARLGFACALLRAPRLLLLDEPANGLDPAGRRDLRALLRDLAAGGVAIVLSSHDLDDVAEVCTDVTVLAQGRVGFQGTLARLLDRRPAALLSTSDDPRALALADNIAGIAVVRRPAGGLAIEGGAEALDAYVLLLGRSGVAVRGLHPGALSLATSFLDLTADPVPAEYA